MDDIYEDKQPKTQFGRFMKRVIAVILILLYAFIMLRLFMSCDSQTTDTVILDSHLKEFRTRSMIGLSFPLISGENRGLLGEDSPISPMVVYSFQPMTTMDDEGRIQIKNIEFFRDAGNLQLTAKINTDYQPVDHELERYSFSLRKISAGKTTVYPLSYRVSDDRYSYRYFRLAFNGVSISEGDEVKLVLDCKNPDDTTRRVFSLKLAGKLDALPSTDTAEQKTEEPGQIYKKMLNPADLEFAEAIIS